MEGTPAGLRGNFVIVGPGLRVSHRLASIMNGLPEAFTVRLLGLAPFHFDTLAPACDF